MKHTLFVIIMLFTGQVFAQNEPNSEQIAKEIRFLELENNKLILNRYISEQTDSTKGIPIFAISQSLVRDFQNTHADIKEMRDSYDAIIKQQDSIKKLDPEYKKLNKIYIASSFDEKKKLEGKFNQIYSRLYIENPKFKDLVNKSRSALNKTNYQILVQMTNEYHEKGEIMPTKFIPYDDLIRYKELPRIKENQKKIDVLNTLHKKILENEFRKKYNISDEVKTDR